MRIYFMLAYARNVRDPNPVLQHVFHLLQQSGCQVELGIASELVWNPSAWTVAADLYVLKSHTPFWMSLAEIMHHQGARMLNPYHSCLATQNKIVKALRMSAAGVPVPEAWIPVDLALLQTIVAQRPLIIKPYMGRRNEGIVIVQNKEDLAQLATPSAPMLVQEYLRGYQEELKVTVIGEQVFAVRLVAQDDGQITRVPCTITEDIRALALKCGRVFGIGLYRMDILLSKEGPVVIDLDYFPSYKGVPKAAQLIAEYIMSYAQGNISELLPSEYQRKPATPAAVDGKR